MPAYISLQKQISHGPDIWEIHSVYPTPHPLPELENRTKYRYLRNIQIPLSQISSNYFFSEPDGLVPASDVLKQLRNLRRTTETVKGLVWVANHFGYGNSFRWFNLCAVKSLISLNVNTRILMWKDGYIDPSLRFPFLQSNDELQKMVSILNARWEPPKELIRRLERHSAAHLGYFQCEATKVATNTAEWFNSFDGMLATSNATKQAMLDSGVRCPIYIYGHGIDPDQFPYIDRPVDRKPYVFFHLADVQNRKGTDLLLRAFRVVAQKRFVRLYIKAQDKAVRLFSHKEDKTFRTADPRIIWDTKNYTPEEMSTLFGQMDCGVFPSRSEGFGLPVLEFEATGGPVIATDAFGFQDTSSGGRLKLTVSSWIPAQFDAGNQAEPDLEHLIHLMGKCADEPEWAKQMGKKASENAHQNWTWKTKAQELLSVLGQYGLKT